MAETFPPLPKLSTDAQRACVFKFGITKKQARQMAIGAWWIVPLGARREEIFGIRIVPGRALTECPVVRVMSGQVQTMVSRPAFLMSWLLYPGTVVNAEAWDMVLQHGEATWSELTKVDAMLGGGGLESIRKVLADDKIRDGHLFSAEPAAFNAAVVEAKKRIDPSPETRGYYDYLMQLKDSDDPIAPRGKLGCWEPAAWDAAFTSAETWEVDPQAAEWGWRFWCGPHGLDCFQGMSTSVSVAPNGKFEIYAKAAQRLSKSKPHKDWQADPRWATVEAFAKDTKGYTGIAHMDAARALKKAGQLEEAFDALTSAAYWFRVNGGDEGTELAEAAQLLAKESGWKNTLEALELAAERINDG